MVEVIGLGLLISGLIFGGAAISAGIDNAKMMSEPYRREAIEGGYLAYKKYDHRVKRFMTCEISTGKYIASLQGKNMVANIENSM